MSQPTVKPELPKAADGPLKFIEERIPTGDFLKRNLRKVFPDHWSFLLGEIALYSFIILLLTGTFLTLWFKPSMEHVVYDGSYEPLKGVMMSAAYESSLHISFEVRGGLLMRQMHHWAALLFVASMMIHMLRVFFTGAYRKPRELNWLIGLGLLTLALFEGLTGYSLPDDLLSGAGLRITQGVIVSLPLVGTYIQFFLFGGEYPGEDIISRFFTIHILLIPGILLGLVTAHLILMWVQKHTQMPGKGRTEKNVVGAPFYPAFMAKGGAFFLFTFGVIALLGAFFQINPIWAFGPYTPADISAGSQPDWYMGFLEGSLRIMVPWEINIASDYTLPLSVLIPALVPLGLIFTGLGVYPFVERWITGDNREHHLCDRPRNAPVRTSIGMAGVTFYGLLWLLGANDEIAANFHISLNATTYFGRVMIFLGPVLAYIITYRICIGLQRRDADVIGHGVETGVIKRLPNGEFIEVHAPASEPMAEHIKGKKEIQRFPDTTADEGGVPAPGMRGLMGKMRVKLNHAYTADDVPLEEHHDGHGEQHGEVLAGEPQKGITRH
ncbi:cytochrome b [Bailinhaonella thermotolerans]|uniref:Cytochrome bc1 complex cytochrome b subunit n=1 Tax=Bailinhaonella thermotolerans TaxID=1070861 RepID=A0A3A4B1Z4_9ACTN|nr:ubiquinol-cytochrome c reductase cytochrome b subunit [Bailinhaonella thermotolerans]RJL31420.1 ubiquinol-cytochrome c reductase cytochrome b subunit [Bailinhaonella thermotolerans]